MYEDYYSNIEDTAAFLRRIGLDPSGIRADKDSLDRILYHHHRYIPFDNLDIWAKAALPELSVPAINDKLVRRRRGGYCFEMNGHLEALLRSLGFTCYGVEIRVVKGRDYMPPYLHRGVIAVIDGEKYFCDVGLGFRFFPESAGFNGGYNGSGVKAVCTDGVVEIWERTEDGETRLLWFRDFPTDPVDFVNPNFCCSQNPETIFRTRLSMVIMTPEGYRKSLVCEAPPPVCGQEDSPAFKVTVTDGSKTLSEETGRGASMLQKRLKDDFGVDYAF